MNPYAEFPHVAVPLLAPSAGPAAAGSDHASDALVRLARPVVLAVGALNNLIDWGFGEPSGFASCGRFLVGGGDGDGGDEGEAVRAALYGEEPTAPTAPRRQTVRARARRVRTPYKTYTMEQADALSRSDFTDRAKLVALKGTRTMARILPPTDPEAVGHVLLTFGDAGAGSGAGARILISRDSPPESPAPVVSIVLYARSQASWRRAAKKTLTATLEGARDVFAVKELFDAPPQVLPPLSVEDDAARAICASGVADPSYYAMPMWFCEHVGSIAQEAFRVHVLASAAQRQSGAGRAVIVDRVSLHLRHDLEKHSECKAELRAVLHAACAECICGAYHAPHELPHERPDGVVLVMRMCGMPMRAEDGCCPCHSAMTPLAAPGFETLCAHDTSAHIACNHEGEGEERELRRERPVGTYLPVRFRNVPEHEVDEAEDAALALAQRNRRIVRELLGFASALARVALQRHRGDADPAAVRAEVQDLRMRCDSAVRTYERENCASGSVPGLLSTQDRHARNVLRGVGVGARAVRMPPSLGATHGHLFPRGKRARRAQ